MLKMQKIYKIHELQKELSICQKNSGQVHNARGAGRKKMNKEMPAYKYVRDIIVTDKELIKTTTQKIKRHEEMKTVI